MAIPFVPLAIFWAWKQRRVERNLDVTFFGRTIAGKFKDGRKTPHPWLRVAAEGRHRENGESYYWVQVGGAHSVDWIKTAEIDLYADEPPP